MGECENVLFLVTLAKHFSKDEIVSQIEHVSYQPNGETCSLLKTIFFLLLETVGQNKQKQFCVSFIRLISQ